MPACFKHFHVLCLSLNIHHVWFTTHIQGPIPIAFTEALNLPALGIASDNIKFGTCSMESDKYICVCEKTEGSSNVVIIDMTQGNTVTRRPISAEAAIMNPVSKVEMQRNIWVHFGSLSCNARRTNITLFFCFSVWPAILYFCTGYRLACRFPAPDLQHGASCQDEIAPNDWTGTAVCLFSHLSFFSALNIFEKGVNAAQLRTAIFLQSALAANMIKLVLVDVLRTRLFKPRSAR